MLSRFARLAALVGHARARNLLVACGLLIGLVLGGTAAWIIVDLHSDHLAHEKQDLTNLAFILVGGDGPARSKASTCFSCR